MENPNSNFFQPNAPPLDKELIQNLIKQIKVFQTHFETSLKQLTTKKERQEIEASLKRSLTCLETLHKMHEDRPVLSEHLGLLIEYLTEIKAAVNHSSLKNYNNTLENDSPDFSH